MLSYIYFIAFILPPAPIPLPFSSHSAPIPIEKISKYNIFYIQADSSMIPSKYMEYRNLIYNILYNRDHLRLKQGDTLRLAREGKITW